MPLFELREQEVEMLGDHPIRGTYAAAARALKGMFA
jgi:hypothetical protein